MLTSRIQRIIIKKTPNTIFESGDATVPLTTGKAVGGRERKKGKSAERPSEYLLLLSVYLFSGDTLWDTPRETPHDSMVCIYAALREILEERFFRNLWQKPRAVFLQLSLTRKAPRRSGRRTMVFGREFFEISKCRHGATEFHCAIESFSLLQQCQHALRSTKMNGKFTPAERGGVFPGPVPQKGFYFACQPFQRITAMRRFFWFRLCRTNLTLSIRTTRKASTVRICSLS